MKIARRASYRRWVLCPGSRKNRRQMLSSMTLTPGVDELSSASVVRAYPKMRLSRRQFRGTIRPKAREKANLVRPRVAASTDKGSLKRGATDRKSTQN
jgi:hypothetical protein